MITYICRNKDIKTGEDLPCTNTVCKTSICPSCGQRADAGSQLYWCKSCKTPIYEEVCPICNKKGKKLATDLRPVFPEERLLLELILGTPYAFLEKSVWNGSGNHYYVDGKRIPFSVKDLKQLNIDKVREEYQKYQGKNTDRYFKEQMEIFLQANRERYEALVEEADEYIRRVAADYNFMEMFVSFSGGKDSTVVSDLVMRALGNPKVLHIFGDTTLEFPFTYEYVKRFKQEHPQTPVITACNKEKDFEELCRMIGPPSRVMRWCCTVFKTGSIQKTIKSLFRNKKEILTFYGIRRSESASRSKYDRDSDSPKITKQRIISPIIDWMDFDIWLYLLTTGIDFNRAYRLGYARVGCWCCPNNSGWSEFLSKIHMKEQSTHFREMLLEFAREIGKEDAEVYVDEGYWKARQGGNGVAYAQKSVIAFEPCATQENTYNYELQKPIETELYELFRPFGYLNYELGNIVYVSPYEHNAVMRTLHFLQKRYGFAIEELSVDAGTLELDLEKIRYQFIQNPPTVLAMTHISNVTGYILPVEEVAALTDTEKTTVIVDGSQALGLIPVRLEQSDIDYYIFAGHKTLYGPFGVGGYIAQSTGNAEKLGLVIAGGTGSNSLNLEMPQLLPDRYEPGSPNVPAIAGLKAAIETFGSNYEEMRQTIEEHYQKERELAELLETELQKIQEVHTYFPQDKEKRSGICSFTIEGYFSDDIGMLLDEDYHIAVRCGYHCAPLIHKYLKDEAYGGTVRVGIGQFNTKEDIRQLIHAVEEIARG